MALAVLLGSLACAPPQPAPSAPTAAGAVSEGGLRVELVFSDDADLDLYVTGPDLETVYFANTPTRAGGALERDLRCDGEPGTRVECGKRRPHHNQRSFER